MSGKGKLWTEPASSRTLAQCPVCCTTVPHRSYNNRKKLIIRRSEQLSSHVYLSVELDHLNASMTVGAAAGSTVKLSHVRPTLNQFEIFVPV